MIELFAPTAFLYKFEPGSIRKYDVRVAFEGFIPILGGQEGKVEVLLGVQVDGLKPDEKGNMQAVSEIKQAKLSFNGAPLPLTLESIQSFFPRNTISLSPTGKTLKTDAPNVSLPVKLPGLDIKRFPDITYLPIVFSEAPVELNGEWKFTKAFGDSDVTYVCRPTKIDDKTAEFEIILEQAYETLEDEGVQVVTKEADAVNRVKTILKGKGVGLFDRVSGSFKSLKIDALAESTVIDLKTKKESKRRLATTLEVTQGATPATPLSAPKKADGTLLGWAQDAWDGAKNWSVEAASKARVYALMVRIAFERAVAKGRGLF